MQLNQRRHERLRFRFPADVWVGEGPADVGRRAGRWSGCSTQDVSTGGVRLEIAPSEAVREGARLRLRVKTAWWRGACLFDGAVCWVRGGLGGERMLVGVSIDAVRPEVRRRWYRALRALARRQGSSEPAPA